MPNKREILEGITGLNTHCWAMGANSHDGEVWSGKEHGASFEMTIPEGTVFERQKDISSFCLVLRGHHDAKGKLRRDFIDVLGEPSEQLPMRRFSNPEILLWRSP